MLKWVVDWQQARTVPTNGKLVWAVEMPKDYPECRVTRKGVAHIAVTDDERLVEQLRTDGGDVKILP